MVREGADKLPAIHLALRFPGIVAVVGPLEGDFAGCLIDTQDALVADRDPTGVARQVTNYGPCAVEGWTIENHPAAASEAKPPIPAAFQAFLSIRPLGCGIRIKLFEFAEKDRTEHPRHRFHRKHVVRPGLFPVTGFYIFAAGADQHV